jgi:hypothetical protein
MCRRDLTLLLALILTEAVLLVILEAIPPS